MSRERHCVFVAGGTGYLGQRLISMLLHRGHPMPALARPESETNLPAGCMAVIGKALLGGSYADRISPADTFVQLVGVAHPSPAKAEEFRKIDLPSGLGAPRAAKQAGIRHFVYVSVAHPAPTIDAYIAVRAECEVAIGAVGLNATILRAPGTFSARDTGGRIFFFPCTNSRRLFPKTRGWSVAIGLGDLRTNDHCTNVRRGESGARAPCDFSPGDSLRDCVKSRAHQGF